MTTKGHKKKRQVVTNDNMSRLNRIKPVTNVIFNLIFVLLAQSHNPVSLSQSARNNAVFALSRLTALIAYPADIRTANSNIGFWLKFTDKVVISLPIVFKFLSV